MNLLAAAALALPASAAYLAPALAAAVRRHPRLLAVLTVNLLLGWTLLGWAVALAMTLRTPAQPSPAGRASAPGGRQLCRARRVRRSPAGPLR
jgi:hypothetical protein